jgi:hypothetical protein
MDAFVSVYVDMAARADDVRAAVATLPLASGLSEALGLPAFAFHDLLRRDYPAS